MRIEAVAVNQTMRRTGVVLQRRERSAGGEARDGIRPHALASIAGTFFEWTALLASACVVAGVALDSIGLRFSPVSITIAALLVLAPFALPHLRDRRRRGIDWPTDLVVLLIGSAVAWQLLAPVGAALLPVGNSVDAVHHASLARYILQHGGLVREPALAVPQLGEMVDYPPGFALLAALLAGTLGTQAYAVVHVLASMAVALTACGIALLAAEGASGTARTAAAAAGLLLLFVPGYSLGIVAAENYYAQALAQCLIVACAYVAARARQARLPIAAGKLGLLLLALVFVYTTWLPVALIVVGAGLLARGERPAARLLTGVVVLGGAAALALLFAGPRASTGSSVVLHEGSTIRDPLGATGWILPLLAAAGLPLGAIRRERWSGLGLIGGTLLLLAVFGMLWLRGAVAGYIYFKVFYLLAIVLPLPIGWLAAGAVQWQIARRPRLVRAFSALVVGGVLTGAAASAWRPLLPSTASEAAHPLTPALVQAARWLEQHGASEAMYALRRPGLPAYWVSVGLLGNARDGTAERLLREAPASFDEWYYDPQAPRYLLLESATAPPSPAGTGAAFNSDNVWVLEKTAAYPAVIARARPLLISFRTAVVDDRLETRLHTAGDAPDAGLSVQLTAVAGDTVLATHSAALPADGASNELDLDFDARSLTSVTGAAGGVHSDIAPAGDGRPGVYNILLQLLHQEQIVAQRELAVCESGACAVVAPGGSWSYALPEGPTVLTETASGAPAPLRLGLGDAIELAGISLERTTWKAGDELTLDLRWNAQATIDQRYVTFVQLIADDGGAAVSVEGEPGSGMAPTWRWHAGDTIDDRWRVPLAADLTPGTYQLVVGMYHPDSGERVPAWRRAPFVERFWSDALPLGKIVVEP